MLCGTSTCMYMKLKELEPSNKWILVTPIKWLCWKIYRISHCSSPYSTTCSLYIFRYYVEGYIISKMLYLFRNRIMFVVWKLKRKMFALSTDEETYPKIFIDASNINVCFCMYVFRKKRNGTKNNDRQRSIYVEEFSFRERRYILKASQLKGCQERLSACVLENYFPVSIRNYGCYSIIFTAWVYLFSSFIAQEV